MWRAPRPSMAPPPPTPPIPRSVHLLHSSIAQRDDVVCILPCQRVCVLPRHHAQHIIPVASVPHAPVLGRPAAVRVLHRQRLERRGCAVIDRGHDVHPRRVEVLRRPDVVHEGVAVGQVHAVRLVRDVRVHEARNEAARGDVCAARLRLADRAHVVSVLRKLLKRQAALLPGLCFSVGRPPAHTHGNSPAGGAGRRRAATWGEVLHPGSAVRSGGSERAPHARDALDPPAHRRWTSCSRSRTTLKALLAAAGTWYEPPSCRGNTVAGRRPRAPSAAALSLHALRRRMGHREAPRLRGGRGVRNGRQAAL